MTKILVDTNIILDLLAKREKFYFEAQQIFSLADTNKIELYISALSIANTVYILSNTLKKENSRNILGKFKVLVKTITLSDKIIELALNDFDFGDFEDGIQYYSACEVGCDLIITRNVKDFKNSKIPIMTPKEYLAHTDISS
ncbi:MAG: PIN domain-containing protein [Saprospiraceae bacterium]|nr:PIN domain-containing protein [Saprospiraceae bacterium]